MIICVFVLSDVLHNNNKDYQFLIAMWSLIKKLQYKITIRFRCCFFKIESYWNSF